MDSYEESLDDSIFFKTNIKDNELIKIIFAWQCKIQEMYDNDECYYGDLTSEQWGELLSDFINLEIITKEDYDSFKHKRWLSTYDIWEANCVSNYDEYLKLYDNPKVKNKVIRWTQK